MNKVAKYKQAAATGLDEQLQDELVRKQAPLVKRIAYHLMSRLPPSVQIDDLIQASQAICRRFDFMHCRREGALNPGTDQAKQDTLIFIIRHKCVPRYLIFSHASFLRCW